ncbi:MAG: lipoprotein intramolecular transacylase Lit [Candidatus Limnocylindrales bacterium]
MTGSAVDDLARASWAGAARALGWIAVALAGPAVIVGLALALVYNPLVLGLEQDRADVAAITGYPSAEVHRVTTAIMSDLILGPPEFSVAVGGAPVLDAAERGHMRDVRVVLLEFGALVLVALVALLGVGSLARSAAWFWRALAAGTGLLAALVVVIGIVFAVFFDQAFLAFHELLFPAGNFAFDPRTERLVQLFPEQFWSETTVVMAVVGLVLAVATAGVAITRARTIERGGRGLEGPRQAASG